MTTPSHLFAAFLFLAGIAAASAAPAISGSELPGRDRQRFLESPVERFMQPAQKSEPLIRWQCDPDRLRAKKQRAKRNSGC